ncbi:MAG: hypothetical protein ABIS01_00345 [Ferruginibacter sp.]
MPVKIVTTATNSQTGEINDADLNKMMDDFRNSTDLIPATGPVIRKYAWYITKEEIDDLFLLNKTTVNGKDAFPTLLEINFAVNVNGVSDMCNGDLSNTFTTLVRGTGDDKKPVNVQEEFVIIPGFNNFLVIGETIGLAQKGCCPSSNP